MNTDWNAQAAEYVLGTLPAEERRAVEARMAQDPDYAAEVRRWEEQLLPLAALAEPMAPPPRLWARLERSLNFSSAQAVQPTPAPLPWWQRGWQSLAFWRSVAGAGMVAAALLGAVALQEPEVPAPRFMVVLVAPEDRAPGWVIQASDARQVNLIPLGTFEVPPDKALEFWTKADDWAAPVSLGLVAPGQRLQVPLDALPPLQPDQLFELTLEPATGSPTGRPTGPIQFIGRAVPVL